VFNFHTASKNINANKRKIEKVILEDMSLKADQYVPEDTGKTRIEMKLDFPVNAVLWMNEYVEFIYWGVHMNFQTVNNPKAQALWADRAANENVDSWAEMYADAIESGF
jgi:hypothetical protein